MQGMEKPSLDRGASAELAVRKEACRPVPTLHPGWCVLLQTRLTVGGQGSGVRGREGPG